MGGRLDLQCVFAWLVLPLACLAAFVASVMWLASLFGGVSHLFSFGMCILCAWWFFSKARQEAWAARIAGYIMGSIMALCAIAITGIIT